jgi:hypothetical protein
MGEALQGLWIGVLGLIWKIRQNVWLIANISFVTPQLNNSLNKSK